MNKEQKNIVSDILLHRVREQKEQLETIEPRLLEYMIGLVIEPQFHNTYEQLCAVKFLRLLRTYEGDRDTLADVLYKYEGTWNKDGGMWRHVIGGVRHPGNEGPTFYRLQPFQVFVLASIFYLRGWFDTHNEAGSRPLRETEEERDGSIWDNRRLCTEFTLYCPRKVAKTQLSAFIQMWFFMCGDANAECYCCANASDQAKILFNRTKDLIHQMDSQERRIRFTASQVNWKPGQFRSASLTALSAGGKTKDGLFAQLCSADEYGSAGYVNGSSDMGKLVSVVESSMGARREPLSFITTTAGLVQTGPFVDKLEGIHNLLAREIEFDDGVPADYDSTLDRQAGLLLEPEEWQRDVEFLLTDRDVRRMINPMLGIIVQHSFYDDEIAKARMSQEKQNEVITKLFNVYQTATVTEWLKADDIRALQIDRKIDDCIDRDGWLVWAGLDFSKGDDLNGVSYLAYNLNTGEFFADMDSYMSEMAANDSPIRELLYKWSDAGWLHIVPGQTFDPSWPVNRIIELDSKGVNFVGFGYDPYNAKVVTNALGQWVFDIGLDPKQMIVPVRQNFASYNPAVNEFDYMVRRSSCDSEGRLVPDPMVHFSRNPLWPWEFSNCVLQESSDGMGNRKPVKRSSGSASCKVDNIQMLLSALMLYDQTENTITTA